MPSLGITPLGLWQKQPKLYEEETIYTANIDRVFFRGAYEEE